MKLQTLTLHNFKVFQGEVTFSLDGRHLLIYGANGSGKSSLFWGLHVLLQSSFKGVLGIEKYFTHGHEESLRNRYVTQDQPCFIKAVFSQGETNHEILVGVDPEDGIIKVKAEASALRFLRDTDDSTDFITHRHLVNWYNQANSTPIDLFPVFKDQVLPYFLVSGLDLGNDEIGNAVVINYEELYKKFTENIRSENKPVLERWRGKINERLLQFCADINDKASQFYNTFFAIDNEDLEIRMALQEELALEGTTKNNRTYKNPCLSLKVTLKRPTRGDIDVTRPQSFLNEARLNAVTMAIRFATLEGRSTSGCRMLALDDLLISLDLPNRMKIIRLILRNFTEDYQLLLFTHDKGFYTELKRRIWPNKDAWLIYEMEEAPKRGEKPRLNPVSEGPMDRILRAIALREYSIAANLLRKEAEVALNILTDPELKSYWKVSGFKQLSANIEQLKTDLQKNALKKFKKMVKNKQLSSEELLLLKSNLPDPETKSGEEKGKINQLTAFRSDLVDITLDCRKDIDLGVHEMMELLEEVKSMVLDPASHFGTEPIYRADVEKAAHIVGELHVKLPEIKTRLGFLD